MEKVYKYKRVSVFGLFLMAIISGLGLFSLATFHNTAYAEPPSMVYSSVPINSLSWGVDRSLPSGGYTLEANNLTMNIDNQKANTSSSFYQTEGLQATISSSDGIKAELYLDPTWAGKTVRAGIWGVAYNNAGSDFAWPIIEFTTMGEGGFTGWRVFDTMNGGWTNLTTVADYGSWYSLEINYNTKTLNYEYYVNDNLVTTKAGNWEGDGYGDFKTVIFNNFNSATGNAADNYAVNWRNLKTGQKKPEAPIGAKFFKGSTEVIAGSTLNSAFGVNNIEYKWNTSDEATDAYQTEITYPDGSKKIAWTGTNNVWIGQTAYGTNSFGQKGDGSYSYRVMTRSSVTGLWSNWSDSIKLIYDNTKPTVTLKSPVSSVMNDKNSLSIQANDNIELQKIVANIYKKGSTTVFRPTSSAISGAVNFTHNIDLGGLLTGDYYVKYNSLDRAGNLSTTITYNFTIDNDAPTVPTAILSAGDNVITTNGYTNLKNFKFNLSSSEDTTRYRLKYWNDIVGSSFKEATPWNPTNLSGYSSALGVYNDQFTQGEGVHYLSFSACDTAGNCSAYSTPFVVTYDKTAPIVAITSQKDGDIVGGKISIQGAITDNNPDHYYLVIKNSLGKIVTGPGTVNKTVMQDWIWDTTKIVDGIYTINLEARDKANNKDSGSVTTATVIVDNIKPVITYTKYTQTDDTITPEITIDGHSSFSWTASSTNPEGATFDDTIIAPTFTVINSGTYEFTLKAIDKQGSEVGYVFKFDYTKPVVLAAVTVRTETTTPAVATDTEFTNVTATPVATDEVAGTVLGLKSETDKVNKDISSGQISAIATVNKSSVWNILGLAWYWWLSIIVMISVLCGIIMSITKLKKQN